MGPDPAAREEHAQVVVRRRSRRYLRRRRRRLLLGLLVAAAVVTVVQLAWALVNLQGASDKLRSSAAAVSAGDFAAAKGYAAQVHDATARARWGTWGPQFWLAERLPVVGDNVLALRTMAEAGEELSGPISDQLFALREDLDPAKIKPVHGRVDVGRFVEAQAPASTLAVDLARVGRQVDAVKPAHLLGPLDRRWSAFSALVDQAVAAGDYSHRVLQVMPDLLGRKGVRHYLVIFQNNAEFRATGGIPGAFTLLTADRGRIAMGRQGVAIDLRKAERPVRPISAEERALYTDRIAEWPQDVNLTPDFPRTGGLLRTMYQRRFGLAVDGVISVDPVTLQAVLKGTGPVPVLYGGKLTADNVVQVLLNGAYAVLPGDEKQNAYFADACRRVFQALVVGKADAGTALRGVFDSIHDGRVLAWLAAPHEQAALAGGAIAGELTEKPTGAPDVGVYLNDSTGTKLDFYVTSTTDVTSVSCTSDGRQRLQATTTLVSKVPHNAGTFPSSLLGNRVSDQPGDLLTSVFAYGPVGGKLIDTTLDGEKGSPLVAGHDGHPVVARTVLLPRGGRLTLTWTFETTPGQTGDPVLRTTPGARSNGIGMVGASSC